jgi:hypothetical protein
MIQRRARQAGHQDTHRQSFDARATGITDYLKSEGTLEHAQTMAAYSLHAHHQALRPAQRRHGPRRVRESEDLRCGAVHRQKLYSIDKIRYQQKAAGCQEPCLKTHGGYRKQHMRNRDDFPEKLKKAVAARASWNCSFTGCAKPTVGPSEESSDAVTMIGKAAHICGAAPGRGSRRYVASMTPEERAGIGNAIWLCADHADLIDRDEVTYSIETLRAMKRDHEALCAQAIRSGKGHDLGAGLLAIGPDIVCTGDIQNISEASWTLRLRHFVVGDVHKLVSFIDGFAKAEPDDRYLLSNELGDGRVLLRAPSLTKQNDGYSLLCPVAPSFPRVDVQDLGTDMALHPETHDLYLDDKGNIARVSGLEYLPQKVQTLLSMQRGESVFNSTFGIRFFEYFEAYKESPWLTLLLTLDVVRQAAIPYSDGILNRQYTPLGCVNRVRSFELLSEIPKGNRLPVRVSLEVQGVGRWQRDLSVYMPTREQMDKRA